MLCLRLPLRPRLRSRLRPHVICYFRLKTASFAFFTLGFYVFSRNKFVLRAQV